MELIAALNTLTWPGAIALIGIIVGILGFFYITMN